MLTFCTPLSPSLDFRPQGDISAFKWSISHGETHHEIKSFNMSAFTELMKVAYNAFLFPLLQWDSRKVQCFESAMFLDTTKTIFLTWMKTIMKFTDWKKKIQILSFLVILLNWMRLWQKLWKTFCLHQSILSNLCIFQKKKKK